MTNLSIALLQLARGGTDLALARARGEAACRQARAMGADIALFPELWTTSYTFERPGVGGDLWRDPTLWRPGDGPATADEAEAIRRWQQLAIRRDDPFVDHFRRLAHELELAIALTYLEAWAGPPRNTVSLIDRHGQIVLTYAKVHTCDFDLPEAGLTPGDGFPVAELDTAAGPVRVGAMICYDREFPEAARLLMLNGAEIILIPNACDLEINRLAQLRARAYENMVGVALANYAGPGLGHSIAFDGRAFDQRGSRDMLLVEAGEGEGIVVARFDLAALRDYRRRETWGNAFRRPHRYGRLTDDAVAPPFVRVDATGERYDQRRRGE